MSKTERKQLITRLKDLYSSLEDYGAGKIVRPALIVAEQGWGAEEKPESQR